MNTPVNFEISKLLKEKGFDLKIRSMYCEEKLYKDTNSKGNYNNLKWVRTWRSSSNDDTVSAPTIAEVVMWIYEKHGIWISVEATDDFTMFCFRVRKKEISRLSFNYNTPIEAYEEAIKYTLNNLIYETN